MSARDPWLERQFPQDQALLRQIAAALSQQTTILQSLTRNGALTPAQAGQAAAQVLASQSALSVQAPLRAVDLLRAAMDAQMPGVTSTAVQMDKTLDSTKTATLTDTAQGGPIYVMTPVTITAGYYASGESGNSILVTSDTTQVGLFDLNRKRQINLGSSALFAKQLTFEVNLAGGVPYLFEVAVEYEEAQMSHTFYQNVFVPLLQNFGLPALQAAR